MIGVSVSQAQDTDSETPDLTGVEVITHRLNDRIYMLEATKDVAGNIGVLLADNGVLIVDDQFEELTPQIEASLQRIATGKLRYILNTHHHLDHSGGNARLANASGAAIVAHDRTRVRLLEKNAEHWPQITFNSQMSLYFGDEHVRMISVPGGHTDNDAIVLFETSNIVHLGDLMNSGTSSFPVADLAAGGNALKILENIEHLISIVPDGATIIPGHGAVTDKAELFRLREMLTDTIGLVVQKMEQGQSLSEIQQAGLQEKYANWGYGYMNADGWIEMIYKSNQ